jgi:hypothetical protein
VAQLVEHLPNKCEALNSIPPKKKKKLLISVTEKTVYEVEWLSWGHRMSKYKCASKAWGLFRASLYHLAPISEWLMGALDTTKLSRIVFPSPSNGDPGFSFQSSFPSTSDCVEPLVWLLFIEGRLWGLLLKAPPPRLPSGAADSPAHPSFSSPFLPPLPAPFSQPE